MRLAIQIAAGIVIATAVVGTARYIVVQAQLRALAETFQQVEADFQQRSHATQVRLQAEQRARQRQVAEAKEAEIQGRADEKRRKAAAVRAEQDAAVRKADAWTAFYRPNRRCDDPPDWDA